MTSVRVLNRRRHHQFRAWLEIQRDRQDPVGDFARDFLVDRCAEDLTTISGIDRHLRVEHDASERVLDARDRAWREFARACPED